MATISCKAQQKGYTETEKLLREEHGQDLSFHLSRMVRVDIPPAWVVHLGHTHEAQWLKQHSLPESLLRGEMVGRQARASQASDGLPEAQHMAGFLWLK